MDENPENRPEQAASSNNYKNTEETEEEMDEETLEETTSTPTVSDNRRKNPARKARQGVSYCENRNELEDILQSEFCKSGLTVHNLKYSIIVC